MQPTPLKFNLTGFSQFGSISQNPTSQLILQIPSHFPSHPSLSLHSCQILDVSISRCQQYFLSDQEAEVFLHLGVSQKSSGFALEQFGYNMADFRIPDVEG